MPGRAGPVLTLARGKIPVQYSKSGVGTRTRRSVRAGLLALATFRQGRARRQRVWFVILGGPWSGGPVRWIGGVVWGGARFARTPDDNIDVNNIITDAVRKCAPFSCRACGACWLSLLGRVSCYSFPLVCFLLIGHLFCFSLRGGGGKGFEMRFKNYYRRDPILANIIR